MPKNYSWKDAILELVKTVMESITGNKSSKRTWHQHVVPYQDGWAVRREGNKRITSKHRKQSTAISRAKTAARKRKAHVIIHRADGTIRDRISFD